MTRGIRMVTVCLMVSLLLAGPWAPIVVAQQPMQPPPPPPGPSTQPDVFQEALKVSRPGAPAPGADMGQPMPPGFYDVAAGVMTGFLIPGRVVTCALGNAAAGALLVITFGSAYRAATRVVEEGCGGKWVLSADDLLPDRQPARGPVSEPR